MEILIEAPSNFGFLRTVASHGWWDLPPFDLQHEGTLIRVLDLPRQRPITISIVAENGSIKITTPRKLSESNVRQVISKVCHMLRLDDDMTGFYAVVGGDPEFAWVSHQGAGRLLRAPTVFEDLVKMICTTNCSWALTKKMVEGLVANLGSESLGGGRSFPSAEAMAEQSEHFYRNEIRSGYRAPYLKQLAEQVASGSLAVESWLTSPLPTAELKREMKKVKGVGDYAAENMLKLVGRYDGLALDSWIRGKFSKMRAKGRKVSDQKIAKFYSRFDSWRGLALWCDMTKDWIEEERLVI